MPARPYACWLILLVLCPFTEPFSASDVAGLFGTARTMPASLLASGPRSLTNTPGSTSVAVVPPTRGREEQGPRLVASPRVIVTTGAISPICLGGYSPWTLRSAAENPASPTVLRL